MRNNLLIHDEESLQATDNLFSESISIDNTNSLNERDIFEI
jgi:hypothetical protein